MTRISVSVRPRRIAAVAVAKQGPPGPAGDDSDASYTHNQSSPASTRTIVHGLGKHPSVSIVDSAGTQVLGQLTYDSINQVTVSFSTAFSGKAYLN